MVKSKEFSSISDGEPLTSPQYEWDSTNDRAHQWQPALQLPDGHCRNLPADHHSNGPGGQHGCHHGVLLAAQPTEGGLQRSPHQSQHHRPQQYAAGHDGGPRVAHLRWVAAGRVLVPVHMCHQLLPHHRVHAHHVLYQYRPLPGSRSPVFLQAACDTSAPHGRHRVHVVPRPGVWNHAVRAGLGSVRLLGGHLCYTVAPLQARLSGVCYRGIPAVFSRTRGGAHMVLC